MRALVGRVACAGMLAAAVLSAQQPAPQFRFERSIKATAGANRLAIDLPLLAGSQPFAVRARSVDQPGRPGWIATGGLGDLRLFDESGLEVQYLLIWPSPPFDSWRPGRVFGIAATKTTSGFEADFGAPTLLDRVRVEGLPAPFLKRALIEASGDRIRWTMLHQQTTLFDLPAEGLRQTELAVPRGTYHYLRLTWDDTNSAVMPLPQNVSGRVIAREEAAPYELTATLPVTRIASEPGQSRYTIELPAPRLPIVSIEPQVDAPYVFRDAVITESRLSDSFLAPVIIGRRTLRRVVREGVVASEMAIPTSSLTEPEVDLAITDADNPPLTITTAVARFAELPWISFQNDGGPVVARWGNSTLQAPRYDLEAIRSSVVVADLADAAWGEVRALTPAAPTAPPVPMPNVGAAIEIARFHYSRAIPPGGAGLIAVPLDAAAIAHSVGPRTNFADVRVVDDRERQVPYVIEKRAEPLEIELQIEPRDAPAAVREPTARAGRSFYKVRLPYENLGASSLVLTTNASVFTRQVRVELERPADQQHRDSWLLQAAMNRWIHADPAKPAPPLTLSMNNLHGTDLVVIVDEGDNSPLPLTSARLLLPSYRVRLFRDAGASLRLMYGHAELGPPSYDLALLSRSVLGVPAREVVAGEEQPVAVAGTITLLKSPRLFWGVLVAAVAVMLVLLVKLIRRET